MVHYLGGRTGEWVVIFHLLIDRHLLRLDYSFIDATTMALSKHWGNFFMELAFVVSSFYDVFGRQFF